MKNEKIQNKIEETYKQMEVWQEKLEEKERIAQKNLDKHQKKLQQDIDCKREYKKLKQESAYLNQKRRENRTKLLNEEQMMKIHLDNDKFVDL
mmetsp:Transcript_3198/g.3105  ORF Transcript_3198/g.3105 Transcript_3198/m.3105 type:complete len:93 (+) Transcript_3198:1282-1560(+)